MDSQTPAKQNVDDKVALIKSDMPNVYKANQAKAADQKGTFELVRRGLRGEPGCFYAFERGHVVGTPFNGHEIMDDVAVNMVQFGCAHVCIFALPSENTNGAH